MLELQNYHGLRSVYWPTCMYCLFGFFLGLRKYILHKAPKGLKQRSLRLMFDDKCSRPEGMLSVSFSHEQRNDWKRKSLFLCLFEWVSCNLAWNTHSIDKLECLAIPPLCIRDHYSLSHMARDPSCVKYSPCSDLY